MKKQRAKKIESSNSQNNTLKTYRLRSSFLSTDTYKARMFKTNLFSVGAINGPLLTYFFSCKGLFEEFFCSHRTDKTN